MIPQLQALGHAQVAPRGLPLKTNGALRTATEDRLHQDARFARSLPSHEALLAALRAGAALLWVRCADSELELRALRLLEESGGQHVHMHGHPAQTDPA